MRVLKFPFKHPLLAGGVILASVIYDVISGDKDTSEEITEANESVVEETVPSIPEDTEDNLDYKTPPPASGMENLYETKGNPKRIFLDEMKKTKSDIDSVKSSDEIQSTVNTNIKNTEKDNIIKLTAKEHFVCHRILCYIYPKNKKLTYAFWFMCNAKSHGQKRYIPSSRAYQEAKILRREVLKQRKDSDETKLKKSLNNARKGKPNWNSGKGGYKLKNHKLFHSQETKNKMSQAHKGKKHSEETKKKIQASNIGKKHKKAIIECS
jgi:hypothetical protein